MRQNKSLQDILHWVYPEFQPIYDPSVYLFGKYFSDDGKYIHSGMELLDFYQSGIFIFLFFNWSIITMLCSFPLYKNINHEYVYTYHLHPTHPGHHRAPSWAPWAILEAPHQLAVSHMAVGVYQRHSPSSLHALLPPTPCPQICLMCHHVPILCVTFVSRVLLISLTSKTLGKP